MPMETEGPLWVCWACNAGAWEISTFDSTCVMKEGSGTTDNIGNNSNNSNDSSNSNNISNSNNNIFRFGLEPSYPHRQGSMGQILACAFWLPRSKTERTHHVSLRLGTRF